MASAALITVNSAGDGPGVQCTLRGAIKAANSDMPSNGCTPGSGPDTIQFQLPTPNTITLGSALDQINSDLSIQGPGASQLAVSGNSLHRIFSISAGKTVSISGLKIADGSVTAAGCAAAGTGGAEGAGVLNGGTLTLDRVVVSGNHVTATDSGGHACAYGAGITNYGTLALNQSTVRGSATEAGAGYQPIAFGGGISNRDGTLTVNQSTVSDNTVHVSAVALAGAFGAGISNIGDLPATSATVTNSTVTNNGEITPGGKGGGIYTSTNLTLSNDTISHNVASAYGGDGGNLDNGGSLTDVTAKNTIIAEALSSGNCAGPLPTSLGNNLSFESTGDTYPCFTAGNGNVFGDPVLGPLQDNGGPTQTRALGPVSAALDAGSGCEATDQRGFLRGGMAGPCDIGAFELGATPPPPPPDTTPPETTLGKARIRQAKHKATFRFFSSEPGSSFLCKLDKKPFAPCRSPRAYKHLKPGKHRFRVAARDAAGNIDLTPAIKKFRLKPKHSQHAR